jgi:hypothetical protein
LPSKRTSREKKKRFSSEYTMLSVLEYLYTNAQKTPVSKYNILTNTPGIKQQRTDRINLIMDTLEQNEYIKSVKTSSNIIFYQITEKGAEAYSQWIKAFLNFARATSNAEQEDII